MPERWSLARRLTRLYVGTTLLFIAAISIASGLFLWSSVTTQVDALANEEVEESTAPFRGRTFDLAEFTRGFEVEQRRHPENLMAWRVWMDGPDRPPIEIGHKRFLSSEWPAAREMDAPVRIDYTRRSRTIEVENGPLLGLVIDGTPQYRQLGWYAVVVSALVAATFAITLLVSLRFFGKVSSILHTVAARLRSSSAEEREPELELEGSPEEFREIASALSETLARIRAESADARIFTAGLAHELRSPVQNLIGETEVALISSREPTVYRDVLRSNLDELRRLGDAVDNFVTICSRNETRATAEREDFDLASEVELRLRRERSVAERNELDLQLEAHGDTSLRGDREALLRAVRNLAQNAIQWSPPRGCVTVTIEGGAEEITVRVDDQGPGVPAELREHIFEPFFRGPAAQGQRIGYGLGLALAKSAVTEHGGRVEVGSSASGGARFTLHIPRADLGTARAKSRSEANTLT
ncbi:MAG: ATP-binding protein [Planctomycetota bacterium]|nr:ATP-binding protein [Planctomycetota bacterium]